MPGATCPLSHWPRADLEAVWPVAHASVRSVKLIGEEAEGALIAAAARYPFAALGMRASSASAAAFAMDRINRFARNHS